MSGRSYPNEVSRVFPSTAKRAFPLFGASVPGQLKDPFFSSVKLLLPLDGTDGQTTTTDLSDSNHTMTFGSAAELDTAQKKFGTASYLGIDDADPSQSFISAADNADWHLGTGKFTIEAHTRPSDISKINMILAQYKSGNTAWHFAMRGDLSPKLLLFRWSTDGSTIAGTISAEWTGLATDVWDHVAVDRDAADDMRLYLNGIVLATQNETDNIANVNELLYVGKWGFTTGGQFPWDGWLDNVRITKDARYAGAFTPPVEPYPTS